MISVVNTPKAKLPARTDLLTVNKGYKSGQNYGGRFALPAEFDTAKFAAGFYQKGQQVLAMQQQQVVVGTAYTAAGWQVWKYPGVAETNESSSKKKKKSKGVDDITGENKAGRPHEVTSTGKDGATFVLMFRPIELQEQVNRAYGDLSLDQMVNEIRGDTLNPDAAGAGGMLTHKDLRQAGDRDVEADREFEEHGAGQSAAVLPSNLPTGSGRARRRETVVHR